jgi:hypothetical protein
MKSSLILLCLIMFFCACKSKSGSESENKPQTTFPGAATSVESVKQLIAGKSFITVKVGLFSPGDADKVSPYEWLDASSDTSAVIKEILEKEMSFELLFNKDSTGIIFYDKQPGFDSTGKVIYVKKAANMTYKVDDNSTSIEKPGIKLKLIVEEWDSFAGRMEKQISTYIVTGADDKGIVLEAPRTYLNANKDVVVFMKGKEKIK